MFYLLIALLPQNCMQTHHLALYAAVIFFWIMTLTPRALMPGVRETE